MTLVGFPKSTLAALAVTTLLAGCANTFTSPSGRTVTIERTGYGIAHISAADHEGIAYGVAYAHAQDNVCQTAEHLLTVRGERSQFLGAQNTGELGLGRLPNTQIDLFTRFHMNDAALVTAASSISADARASLRGYVAGYNRYLRDAGANGLPDACRGKPWVRPMTQADLSRTTEMSMIQGGMGALAGAVLAAAPPVAGTKTGTTTVELQQAIAEIARHSFNANPEGGELGSNGWAFGRNATPDGRGLLLGNPHFPWQGTNRFWQMHLTIPGRLDVMGATGGLSPVVSIGFNKDVAWTHTVSTGKRFTLYELKLDPTDPTVYVVDGQPKKMAKTTVVLPADSAPGATPAQHTFYTTDWGPVVSLPRAGLGWTATTAYALRDANTLNTRSLETWMAMGVARNVAELRSAMGNQGIPWINTIAADRDGNAMYADLSVVPDVSADMLKACAPSPRAAALLNAAGLPVLDGSRAACAWNRDSAAASPGLIPPSRMPVIMTTDWVQNSNDSYWLSNPHLATGGCHRHDTTLAHPQCHHGNRRSTGWNRWPARQPHGLGRSSQRDLSQQESCRHAGDGRLGCSVYRQRRRAHAGPDARLPHTHSLGPYERQRREGRTAVPRVLAQGQGPARCLARAFRCGASGRDPIGPRPDYSDNARRRVQGTG